MVRNSLWTALAAGAAASLMAAAAQAAPVQWQTSAGGNGHYYDFVAGAFTWEEAFAAANAATLSTPGGEVNGYLATITSAGENAFLVGIAPNGWFGGSDRDEEGTWVWMNGPELGQVFWSGGPGGTAPGGSFASWNGGEPNNLGNEDYAHTNNGAWNDYPNGISLGYYVEFDAAPAVGGVPEPSAWALMILGFGAAGSALRRRGRAVHA